MLGDLHNIRDLRFCLDTDHEHIFVTADDSGTARFWDLRKPTQHIKEFKGDTSDLNSIALSADPTAWNMMLTAGRDRFVRVSLFVFFCLNNIQSSCCTLKVWNWAETSTEVSSRDGTDRSLTVLMRHNHLPFAECTSSQHRNTNNNWPCTVDGDSYKPLCNYHQFARSSTLDVERQTTGAAFSDIPRPQWWTSWPDHRSNCADHVHYPIIDPLEDMAFPRYAECKKFITGGGDSKLVLHYMDHGDATMDNLVPVSMAISSQSELLVACKCAAAVQLEATIHD